MHRPRRVGGDIFDVYPFALPHGGATIVGRGQNTPDHALPDIASERQVDKAGTGDIHRRDPRVRLQFFGQFACNLARVRLGRFRQHHRGIGGHISVQGIARRLDRHIGKIKLRGQRALGLQRLEAGDHEGADIGKEVHGGPLALQGRATGVNDVAQGLASCP